MQFPVNVTRVDPYRNFKFRVVWDGQVVAGVSKISGLKFTTEVVSHRNGGDPSTKHHMPGVTTSEAVTLERGITHNHAFEELASKVYSVEGDGGMSLRNFRKDISIELYNLQGVKVLAYNVFRCWVSEISMISELDANGNAVAFESIVLQNEGFQRDTAVVEVAET